MNLPSSQFNKVVGIVGGAASGKDTVARIFERHGYPHQSASDLVREEIARRGQTTSRQLQTEVANELRSIHSPGYWVDLSIARIGSTAERAVVSGLYSPAEGIHLINVHKGILVSVTAAEDNLETRYERLRARQEGARDAMSFDDFQASHQRENGGSTPEMANIASLASLAHYTIRNTAGLPELEEQTLQVINSIEGKMS